MSWLREHYKGALALIGTAAVGAVIGYFARGGELPSTGGMRKEPTITLANPSGNVKFTVEGPQSLDEVLYLAAGKHGVEGELTDRQKAAIFYGLDVNVDKRITTEEAAMGAAPLGDRLAAEGRRLLALPEPAAPAPGRSD